MRPDVFADALRPIGLPTAHNFHTANLISRIRNSMIRIEITFEKNSDQGPARRYNFILLISLYL
jgi:hypothetical protein